jgi:uncharacterized LabA/DUF88 family protein
MNFKSAILYDIENLIGGYGKADLLSNLSLKDIHQEILKKDIGRIAIQRAYANWSDSRLNILRGDIIELGIEPVQMFGFGRAPTKNASDIQLAIDAIDIAFTRSAIEIFIIVSGDGGFSSLAKKLHEYGNMVIGCAYRKTTNRVFEAVCDDFVWIEEPRDDYANANDTAEFTHPILIDFARKFGRVHETGRENIVREARAILHFLSNNGDGRYLLENFGLNISIFSQAMSYRVQDFNYLTVGFTKFVDFLRYVVNGSKVKLVHKPPSEYRLLKKQNSVSGFWDVPPLAEPGEIHTPENYTQLLSKGAPIFRLPNKEAVFAVCRFMAENKSRYQCISLGDIIGDAGLHIEQEQNEIKAVLLSLVSAGCFMREPEEAKLSEQKLSFIPVSGEQAKTMLKDAMQNKLIHLFGEIDQRVFSEIIR